MRFAIFAAAILASLATLVPTAAADVGLPDVATCDTGTWVDRAVCIVNEVAGPAVDLALDVTFYVVGVALDAAGVVVGVVMAIVVIGLGLVGYVVKETNETCQQAIGVDCISAMTT